MMESNIPNVIIAGAPKCGTTSVFNWLSVHPAVCPSTEKETYFLMDDGYPLFRQEKNYHKDGLDGYSHFFSGCSGDCTIYLEATPDYLYQKTSLDVIEKLPTVPLIVFVLRKPSERVYSLFQFARNNMSVIDKNIKFVDFVDMVTGRANREKLYGDIILENAVLHSQYVEYLRTWVERLGNEQIYVCLFEDLKNTPADFMFNLANRLNIDPSVYDSFDYSVYNASYEVKSHVIHRLKKSLSPIVPHGLLRSILRSMYFSVNAKALSGRSTEELNALKELDRYFENYNRDLGRLFEIDLRAWK